MLSDRGVPPAWPALLALRDLQGKPVPWGPRVPPVSLVLPVPRALPAWPDQLAPKAQPVKPAPSVLRDLPV